jgi:hypothetical protein
LSNFVESAPSDETLIIQGSTVVSEDNKILKLLRFSEIEISIKNPEIIIKHDLLRKFGSPYCKLFNKQIIKCNKINFPLGVSLGEDLLFVLNYYQPYHIIL